MELGGAVEILLPVGGWSDKKNLCQWGVQHGLPGLVQDIGWLLLGKVRLSDACNRGNQCKHLIEEYLEDQSTPKNQAFHVESSQGCFTFKTEFSATKNRCRRKLFTVWWAARIGHARVMVVWPSQGGVEIRPKLHTHLPDWVSVLYWPPWGCSWSRFSLQSCSVFNHSLEVMAEKEQDTGGTTFMASTWYQQESEGLSGGILRLL